MLVCLTLLVICTVSHGNRFNVATISSRGCQYYSKTECHSGGLGIKVIQIMPKIPHSTCIAPVVFSKMRVGALCPDLPTFQDILYVYKMYCPPHFTCSLQKSLLHPHLHGVQFLAEGVPVLLQLLSFHMFLPVLA